MAKITTPDKQSGQTHSAQEYNAFKRAINDLYEAFGTDGKILLSKLPDILFEDPRLEYIIDNNGIITI